PGAGLNAPFDVQLRSLFHVVADDFGGALEGDQIVPLRAIGPGAGLVFGAVRRSQRKGGDGRAAARKFNFWIFPDISYQDDFVDTLRHDRFSGSNDLMKNSRSARGATGSGRAARLRLEPCIHAGRSRLERFVDLYD